MAKITGTAGRGRTKRSKPAIDVAEKYVKGALREGAEEAKTTGTGFYRKSTAPARGRTKTSSAPVNTSAFVKGAMPGTAKGVLGAKNEATKKASIAKSMANKPKTTGARVGAAVSAAAKTVSKQPAKHKKYETMKKR